RQVAEEDGEAAALGMWIVDRTNHFVVLHFMACSVLAKRLARYRKHIAMQRAFLLEQLVQYRAYAAGVVHVFDMPVGSRCDLRQMRHALSYFVNTLDRIVDAGFVSDSQRMKHGIR